MYGVQKSMLKKSLTATLIILAAFSFCLATYAHSDNLVATLNDEKITIEILETYVKDVAGKNYELWLHNDEGLRKLADFFINRTLLLEYAKKTVDKKNTIVTNHGARSVDADVMLLSSLLQSEVQDKIHVTAEDIHTYMEKNKTVSEKQARQKIESGLKNDLMDALVAKVRAGHNIQYFN
jgi:hypothetical protein